MREYFLSLTFFWPPKHFCIEEARLIACTILCGCIPRKSTRNEVDQEIFIPFISGIYLEWIEFWVRFHLLIGCP